MNNLQIQLLEIPTRWAKAHRVTYPRMSAWRPLYSTEGWEANIAWGCVDCALYYWVPMVLRSAELVDKQNVIEHLVREQIHFAQARMNWFEVMPCDARAIVKFHKHRDKERKQRERAYQQALQAERAQHRPTHR